MIKTESFPLMAIKKILHTPMRLPYFVQIDITNVCNLSCTMCPIHYLGIEKTHIDYEIFKKIINNLYGAKEVDLVGLGEPLIYPKIIEAIEYCKANGLIVKITTNGTLLNNDDIIKKLISSGLDSISFSVESINNKNPDNIAHRNNTVIMNIERLIELKRQAGSTAPKICIQTVLFKNKEDDVYEIIKWGAQHGIQRINVLRMHLYFDIDAQRPDSKEEKMIFKEFARLRKAHKIRIDCLQDQFFTGLKGFLYRHLKYLLRLDSYCTRLLDFPVISQKGDMIPCCVLPDCKFGNILEQRVEDVWHGEKITNFRKNHNKIKRCSRCDCWRIKQLV